MLGKGKSVDKIMAVHKKTVTQLKVRSSEMANEATSIDGEMKSAQVAFDSQMKALGKRKHAAFIEKQRADAIAIKFSEVMLDDGSVEAVAA